jgi:hypothetical protein
MMTTLIANNKLLRVIITVHLIDALFSAQMPPAGVDFTCLSGAYEQVTG